MLRWFAFCFPYCLRGKCESERVEEFAPSLVDGGIQVIKCATLQECEGVVAGRSKADHDQRRADSVEPFQEEDTDAISVCVQTILLAPRHLLYQGFGAELAQVVTRLGQVVGLGRLVQ